MSSRGFRPAIVGCGSSLLAAAVPAWRSEQLPRCQPGSSTHLPALVPGQQGLPATPPAQPAPAAATRQPACGAGTAMQQLTCAGRPVLVPRSWQPAPGMKQLHAGMCRRGGAPIPIPGAHTTALTPSCRTAGDMCSATRIRGVIQTLQQGRKWAGRCMWRAHGERAQAPDRLAACGLLAATATRALR